MNWMLAAAWAPAAITLGAVIFGMGENRQQFREHARRIDGHDAKFNANDSQHAEIAEQLADHAEQIAEARGFMRGVESSGKIQK